MPAAINIITRCNGSTAGSCFHKVKTAEAPFQSFLFVPKLLFTAVLLMQNCKRTVNQVMSVNPNFSCPPFLALPEGLALWNPQERFNASLPAANLERTANQIKSVRPSYPVRPSRLPKGSALWNPAWVLRRGCFDPMFLCAFAQQTRVGGDSVESSKVCSLPPNENC